MSFMTFLKAIQLGYKATDQPCYNFVLSHSQYWYKKTKQLKNNIYVHKPPFKKIDKTFDRTTPAANKIIFLFLN